MLWSEINTIISDLTNADTTSFPTATRLIYANEANYEISGDIMAVDYNWQWDDTNYTDLPIGTANLVAGQQDYQFNDEMIEVERIEVLDNAGIWHKLDPIDKREIDGALSEYQKTNGLPIEYDKQGDVVFLYPAPASGSVTLTSGLKVYFKRKAQSISSFGSTSPGFAFTLHKIIAYMVALPYCLKFHQDRVSLYQSEILKFKKMLKENYSRRAKDEPIRFKVAYHSNK